MIVSWTFQTQIIPATELWSVKLPSSVTYMARPVSMATLLSSMQAVVSGQRRLLPFLNSPQNSLDAPARPLRAWVNWGRECGVLKWADLIETFPPAGNVLLLLTINNTHFTPAVHWGSAQLRKMSNFYYDSLQVGHSQTRLWHRRVDSICVFISSPVMERKSSAAAGFCVRPSWLI